MYHILLTDDEQIVTDSLAFILEKNFPSQVEVFKASSGSEAINICRSQKIDIIFMDINMPGLNGLDTISEIKQFNPSAVVIILSAFDKFQYAQEAMSLGAYRYLTKPVNRNLVTQTVRNAMGIIDSLQGKLSNDIEIKEKLSFVSSIVESDFIYSSIYSGAADVKDLHRYLEYFKIPETSYFYLCIEYNSLHISLILYKLVGLLSTGRIIPNRMIVPYPRPLQSHRHWFSKALSFCPTSEDQQRAFRFLGCDMLYLLQ